MNSGESFEPDATVPVPAGGFVRRVAHTPHYDGVKKGEPAPAIIGIFGQAPIDFKLVDPGKPPVRAVRSRSPDGAKRNPGEKSFCSLSGLTVMCGPIGRQEPACAGPPHDTRRR